jgi:RNA-directed DNA polymerase
MEEVEAPGESFGISREEVRAAWVKVRGNQGAAGVDGVSAGASGKDLRSNLCRIWNRMSSGAYFPPDVEAVAVPKSGGGAGMPGVPSVGGRVAQTVAAARLPARMEPVFHPDSYGCRQGRSALDAVASCRQRCWRFEWVVDSGIRKFSGTVPWDKVVACVEAHTDARWVVLYVRRWPAAGLRMPGLFLHHSFDVRTAREFPGCPFERYADGAVIHCRTSELARAVLGARRSRMAGVGLELHPDKTKIVCCQDGNRRGSGPGPGYPHTQFTFPGFAFRPRGAVNKHGAHSTSFQPAISKEALKRLSETVWSWRLRRRTGGDTADLRKLVNPVPRGRINHYGRCYRPALHPLLQRVDTYLLRWIRKKYRVGLKQAIRRLAEGYALAPRYFAHWALTPPPAGR